MRTATEAAGLHGDTAAPAHLVRAMLLRQLGRTADARAAVQDGFAALVPGQEQVRAQLQALEEALR